jgi:ubiquinone/menaquinone biosynthesis C-methylase UbiE
MPRWLDWIQRQRALRKVHSIAAYFPEPATGLEVLDLGAGEGFVGMQILAQKGCSVTLADVLPMNKTELPHVCYDGRTLPFADQAFDVTVLYFVLHHCEDQERVLQEALRVTRQRTIIVESVYEAKWDFWLLSLLDRLANRVRSVGLMMPL